MDVLLRGVPVQGIPHAAGGHAETDGNDKAFRQGVVVGQLRNDVAQIKDAGPPVAVGQNAGARQLAVDGEGRGHGFQIGVGMAGPQVELQEAGVHLHGPVNAALGPGELVAVLVVFVMADAVFQDVGLVVVGLATVILRLAKLGRDAAAPEKDDQNDRRGAEEGQAQRGLFPNGPGGSKEFSFQRDLAGGIIEGEKIGEHGHQDALQEHQFRHVVEAGGKEISQTDGELRGQERQGQASDMLAAAQVRPEAPGKEDGEHEEGDYQKEARQPQFGVIVKIEVVGESGLVLVPGGLEFLVKLVQRSQAVSENGGFLDGAYGGVPVVGTEGEPLVDLPGLDPQLVHALEGALRLEILHKIAAGELQAVAGGEEDEQADEADDHGQGPEEDLGTRDGQQEREEKGHHHGVDGRSGLREVKADGRKGHDRGDHQKVHDLLREEKGRAGKQHDNQKVSGGGVGAVEGGVDTLEEDLDAHHEKPGVMLPDAVEGGEDRRYQKQLEDGVNVPLGAQGGGDEIKRQGHEDELHGAGVAEGVAGLGGEGDGGQLVGQAPEEARTENVLIAQGAHRRSQNGKND